MVNNYVDFYKEASAVYNESRLDSERNLAATLDIIQNALYPKSVVLDIGCGTGIYGYELMKRGFTVFGIDKAPSQVEIAKKKINAICPDVKDIGFPEGYFDACLMIMMIHQLTHEERKIAFNNIKRVLKRNGLLIIKTCSHNDISHRNINLLFEGLTDIDICRYPDNDLLLSELKEFNLKEIKHLRLSINTSKKMLIKQILMRGSSGFGLLEDDVINQGIERIRCKYADSEYVSRDTWYTFYIMANA